MDDPDVLQTNCRALKVRVEFLFLAEKRKQPEVKAAKNFAKMKIKKKKATYKEKHTIKATKTCFLQ